jgi:hypothetical protein
MPEVCLNFPRIVEIVATQIVHADLPIVVTMYLVVIILCIQKECIVTMTSLDASFVAVNTSRPK